MTSLADAYDRDIPWQTITRGILAFGGGLAVAAGAVAAAASLIAGFGVGKPRALRIAVVIGGALLPAGFLAPAVRGDDEGSSRLFGAAGVAVATASLAWFWTALPAGWIGEPGAVPAGAAVTYAVGLLAAFGAGFTAWPGADRASPADRRGADTLGSVESVVTVRDDEGDGGASPAVGDGGEPDRDLVFFDDEQ